MCIVTFGKNNLIIFGTGQFAQIARCYFEELGNFQVLAFVVDDDFHKDEQIFELPVVKYSEVALHFQPSSTFFHVALLGQGLNTLRQGVILKLKKIGFTAASYVSPHAFVHPTAKIGEHSFIFESNTIQPFVELGNNVLLWSGNHIGHHSKLGHNVFITSQVVISGNSTIENNCYVGVNATISNNLTIGSFSIINAGSIVTDDVPPLSLVKVYSKVYETINLDRVKHLDKKVFENSSFIG